MFLLVSTSLGETQLEKEIELSNYLTGLKSAYEVVRRSEKNQGHVVSYLGSLKRTSFNQQPTSGVRYQLARELLDCHHLCYALYHQSYYLSEDLPVIELAEEFFPGLKKACRGEGGIWLNKIHDYFEANPKIWEP